MTDYIHTQLYYDIIYTSVDCSSSIGNILLNYYYLLDFIVITTSYTFGDICINFMNF